MSTLAPSSFAGQLLLAMPGIGDARFAQAVIALCAHGPDGALGIGVGRVVPRFGLHKLLEQLEIESGEAPAAPVFVGGPVEPQRGFVLHSRDWSGEDTMPISDALGLTSTLDVLRAIATGAGPERWLVALGYAGWGANQLDGEMRRHGWFTVAIDDSLLFDVPVVDRWHSAFASAGVDVRLVTSVAGNA